MLFDFLDVGLSAPDPRPLKMDRIMAIRANEDDPIKLDDMRGRERVDFVGVDLSSFGSDRIANLAAKIAVLEVALVDQLPLIFEGRA
jgi:hypothetical protein